MTKAWKWFRFAALLPLVSVPGCATITTGVDPAAKEAGVARGAQVVLYGNTEGVRVFSENGTPMRIVSVPDPTFRQVLASEAARIAAEQRGAATYTETMRYSPAVYLNQKQKVHKLRVVRPDGSSVILTRSGKLGKRYVVMDWLLFAPTLGFSLWIDMATGKWRRFDDINVDQEFQRAAPAGSTR